MYCCLDSTRTGLCSKSPSVSAVSRIGFPDFSSNRVLMSTCFGFLGCHGSACLLQPVGSLTISAPEPSAASLSFVRHPPPRVRVPFGDVGPLIWCDSRFLGRRRWLSVVCCGIVSALQGFSPHVLFAWVQQGFTPRTRFDSAW